MKIIASLTLTLNFKTLYMRLTRSSMANDWHNDVTSQRAAKNQQLHKLVNTMASGGPAYYTSL